MVFIDIFLNENLELEGIMRKDAVKLEETRVANPELENYPPFKERHRVFPGVFEERQHHKILDLAAGIGYVTKRVFDSYPSTIISHDISPSCLKQLHQIGAPTLAFDIDNFDASFPFASRSFDAIISLVTIEHLLFVNEFLSELHRILSDDGYLYISTPNYAAPEYLIQPLIFGRTFHDPLLTSTQYEFYAHVRYFTYRTLLELTESYGFSLNTVYIALPAGSARYKELRSRSKLTAFAYRNIMRVRHLVLPASWASEPILCFEKTEQTQRRRHRKVVL